MRLQCSEGWLQALSASEQLCVLAAGDLQVLCFVLQGGSKLLTMPGFLFVLADN